MQHTHPLKHPYPADIAQKDLYIKNWNLHTYQRCSTLIPE